MPLDNMWNFGYIGEFYLGSGEPQKIRVLFDTGSANSWVISKQAMEKKSADLQDVHYFYDKDLSSTFNEPEQ